MECKSSIREKKDSEKTLEATLRDRVKKLGGLALKLEGNMYAGMPDRLVLMPGGKCYFVELKSEGQKPRKLQEIIHNKLRTMGYEVFVVDTKEKLNNII